MTTFIATFIWQITNVTSWLPFINCEASIYLSISQRPVGLSLKGFYSIFFFLKTKVDFYGAFRVWEAEFHFRFHIFTQGQWTMVNYNPALLVCGGDMQAVRWGQARVCIHCEVQGWHCETSEEGVGGDIGKRNVCVWEGDWCNSEDVRSRGSEGRGL